MTEPTTGYPQQWASLGQDFDPQAHMMQIKGKDYLNVQNRLIWFIRDQRMLINAGLSHVAYVIQTDLVEHDRDAGWAHFKTYVRDVLGNEATMYGSESMRDFPDYIEKASTKSLGRALLLLGYGTAFTAEIDEGDRVVDAPTPATTNAPHGGTPAVSFACSRNAGSAAKPKPALSPAQTHSEPALPTYEEAMQRIEEWCRENGVTGETLKAYCNRKHYTSKNVQHMRQLLVLMGSEEESAVILVMQLAAKHLTTLEVMSQIMRGQDLKTFAEFWRSYQDNPDDWESWFADYFKTKASA